MGSLTLPDDLPKGQARELTPGELAALRLGKLSLSANAFAEMKEPLLRTNGGMNLLKR